MEKYPISLSVVIPAYNEVEGISGVIAALESVLSGAVERHEIIVVDDASTDRTPELAREAGATVISHPANAGYGQALLTGFDAARYDYVAMIDADGSYPPSEMTRLLPFARSFDMVVGARHGANYWGTLFKFPIRIVFLWLAEFVTGQSIPDGNSGLRIMKKSSIPSGPILCRGFSFSTTLTLLFLTKGLFVKFVTTDYLVRKGNSKIRFVRDTLRTSQVIVEALIFHNPLKLAIIVAAVPLLLCLLFLGWFLYQGNPLWMLGAAISLFAAILFFLLGALMDQLRLTQAAGR